MSAHTFTVVQTLVELTQPSPLLFSSNDVGQKELLQQILLQQVKSQITQVYRYFTDDQKATDDNGTDSGKEAGTTTCTAATQIMKGKWQWSIAITVTGITVPLSHIFVRLNPSLIVDALEHLITTFHGDESLLYQSTSQSPSIWFALFAALKNAMNGDHYEPYPPVLTWFLQRHIPFQIGRYNCVPPAYHTIFYAPFQFEHITMRNIVKWNG
jgi:hypothetical protein